MGKIRVKTLGDETQEQEELQKQQEKREQKDMREGKKSHVPGMKGGERTVSVGVSEEEIAAELEKGTEAPAAEEENKEKKEKGKKKVRVQSKRYKENKQSLRSSASPASLKKPVSLQEALVDLRNFKSASFDETVELHINTKEKGLSGTIALPHGTGKQVRVVIADDYVLSQVEKGKIEFDVLVATPQMMPKLARVAKVLGPKGLMPNPKNGTITDKPEEAVKKLSAGQISFRTEAQAPIIHLSVGKLSFDDKKLSENISVTLSSIGATRIESVILKSTMSPAIRIAISSKV